MRKHLRYIVVTPARDEEEHLPRLAQCIARQTLQPERWVIVDDGSSDTTAEIANTLALQNPRIKFVRLPDRGRRQRGPGVVRAFYAGYEAVMHMPHEVVAKLDADTSFGDETFAHLLRCMSAEPRLGICGGGMVVENKNGDWMPDRKLPLTFVRGPMKVYRCACFQEIGGIVPFKGWDGIDDIKAMIQGWIVRRQDDVVVKHHRYLGDATGVIRSSFENGFGGHYMGSLFLYNLFEAAQFACRRPYVVRGLAMLAGYLWGALKRHRINDPAVLRFIRAEQAELLRQKVAALFRFRKQPLRIL